MNDRRCDHDHHHEHGHGHGHGHHGHHHHAPDATGRAFMIGITLNTLFILAEVGFGLAARSLALLADAGHNVSDVLGLCMAWGAVWLGQKKPSARFTYGLRSSSILAALANAIFLLVATGGIAWEAVVRLFNPEPVESGLVMAVAAVGIVINGATAMLFMAGRKNDLNIRAAFAHMAADALVSAGVVIAGLLILLTGWSWLDPAVGLVISAVIVIGTWGLLKDSLGLALHAVPPHIDAVAVRDFLARADGVQNVHDLHIWGMSTSDVALSAHLRMKNGHPGDPFLRGLSTDLRDKFHIGHSTIQIELGDEADCPLASDHVI
jgi:cobalt-zinc-cadmium efflux system protein